MTRRKADAARSRRPAAAGPGSDDVPAHDASDAPAAAAAQPPERKRRARKKPARRPSAVDYVEVADDALATVVGLAAHEVP
ncbi:MAG: hypothetical protein K0A98_11390, partial [Trueperaceae bacterium]|nr:hypothetical protein [Trueperaceae bacterium]